MSEMLHLVGPMAVALGMVTVCLLCVAGIVLSCLSISGTWLVVAGAITAALIRPDAFPGFRTVVIFVVLAALVEVAEALAGFSGVRKRGGSRLAGVTAVVGGLIGLAVGSFVPVPVIGGLAGMLIVSFALVFAVEVCRFRKTKKAVRVAFGAVLSRVFVILLKVCVTLGMAGYLLGGIFVESVGNRDNRCVSAGKPCRRMLRAIARSSSGGLEGLSASVPGENAGVI